MTNGNSAERFAEWAADYGFTDEQTGVHQYALQVSRDAWDKAISVCADGGKGDEHDSRMWDAGYSAGIDFERRRKALLADGGKGEAVYQVRPRNGEEWTDVSEAQYKICGGVCYVRRILYYTAPQAECAPREAQPDQQKQGDLTEVESLAKCEPEEDGSLSVNELFAMQAENAAPTPKLYAHPIASADELIDGGSSK